MNKHLVVIGIVVLLLAVGLSGCINEIEKNNNSENLNNYKEAITINFAGNLSDWGGPYYMPPDCLYDSSPITLVDHKITSWREGYYTNSSEQSENWIYINCSVTDADFVYLHLYKYT